MISPSHKLSVRSQCELLELHRSGIYYAPVGESDENLRLMRELDERHPDYPKEGESGQVT